MLVESRDSLGLITRDALTQLQKDEKQDLDTSTDLQSEMDSQIDDWIDVSSMGSVAPQTLPSIPIARNDSAFAHTTQDAILPVARDKHDLVGTRLARFLQEYSEPIAISCRRTMLYKSYFATLYYSHGPTHMKRWTEKGEELFGVMSDWGAYGTRVAIRLPIIYSRTLSLAIYVQRESRRLENVSIRFSVSFPSIVPDRAPIMEASNAGDVESIKAMFVERRAAYTDTTPNGTCPLHVRLPRISVLEKKLIKDRLLREKVTRG